MSRTIRKWHGKKFKDGEIQNLQKDKKPKKMFVWRGDGWATKARGGPGNKAGWRVWMPKWLYKKLKNE